MNLDHYIEELKTLVNVDCGTQTLAGWQPLRVLLKRSGSRKAGTPNRWI
jgi:hypothetical protein